MPSVIEVLPEQVVRTTGFLVLSQDEVDTLHGGNPDVRDHIGGTIYMRQEEAIFSHPVALDPKIVVFGNICQYENDFERKVIYLYEVAAFGDVVWGPISGVTEGILRTLAWIRFASVPSGLSFYSYDVTSVPSRT